MSQEYLTSLLSDYRDAVARADGFHLRLGVCLTAVVALGGATAALARPELAPSVGRADVFVLFASVVTSTVLLTAAVFQLFRMVRSRPYDSLPPNVWLDWRAERWLQLCRHAESASAEDAGASRTRESRASQLEADWREAAAIRVAEACTDARRQNAVRMKHLNRAYTLACLAFGAVVAEAIMAFVLRAQGI